METPNTKHQTSSKLQTPNPNRRSTVRAAFGWCLKFDVSLVFGFWCLVFVSGCSKEPVSDAPPSVSVASLDRSLASIIETSRQAVVTAPRSGEAWGRLGMALHAAEFYPEARICYARATWLDPQAPR